MTSTRAHVCVCVCVCAVNRCTDVILTVLISYYCSD